VFFDVARKRCATYQEAGFPAGRWRLPTLAEVSFVIYLQKMGVVQQLFISGSGAYWTSSGGAIQNTNGLADNIMGKYWKNYKDKNKAIYVRCVYDTWYWGDTPVDGATDVYTPKPTL
jgi:hypothetical protein